MVFKSLLIAALAVPAAVFGSAIPATIPPSEADTSSVQIVGGTTAAAGDAPFIVTLLLNGSLRCGGSLLNANTVITAAHCVGTYSASQFSIRYGSLRYASGGTVVKVSKVTVNPSYDDGTTDYDVAIFKLSTTVPTSSTVGYASLAASGSDPASGSTLTVAGWGATSAGGSVSSTLLKVSVPVVARATCNTNYQSLYGESGLITDRMFCAGVTAGGKDSCQGDSGGPIFDSSKTLVGVVSWGYSCAEPNAPGVYTRLGNAAINTFITSNLA
ncbi:trypsin-domain-containing protein [Massarina eburnea CBS 473.64]|uniref:Trypsin-domain-containing protein n=1 Tax=Massarina eburnea CBS 473.64 TaxID=1395130 RepID=A0A6A6S2W5_9PLEO|nr:trypsin-domain-containing protein [Massarina eburnea CBS 473.64]